MYGENEEGGDDVDEQEAEEEDDEEDDEGATVVGCDIDVDNIDCTRSFASASA